MSKNKKNDDENNENNGNSDLQQSANSNIITLYVNDFNEESLKEFREQFLEAEKSGQTIIPIVIDSYGGELYSLLGMADIISASQINVATIAISKAMSCGAGLLSCGTKGFRYVSERCDVMIHEISAGCSGKNVEIQNDAKETDRLNNVYFKMMDENCGKAIGYWKSQLKDVGMIDLHLPAKDALKHGIADHVGLPSIKAVVSVDTVLVL